jgi:ABC-type glycerol-3-phosphate transport system substrate-binding protein
MRLIILAAASALAIAACSPSEPAADSAAPAETAAPAEHADGHGAMDDSMKTADTTDDANTAETPEGYTFHTYPAKVEVVHLPSAAGGSWTATASDAALVEVGEAKDETMPDGTVHHTVKVTPKASGNAEVKFERRASANAADPVVETRTVKFMVH